MVVVGDDGFVMVAVTGPFVCVHNPVPTVGVFPAMVMVLPHLVITGPALADVTVLTVTFVFSVVVPHSLVTASVITCAPSVGKLIGVEGFCSVELAGVPPAKVHK